MDTILFGNSSVFFDYCISNKTDLALDVINKISINHKTCKIIVTSSNYSTDTIIKAMRAGAREFLPKPVIKEQLFAALDKLKELVSGLRDDEK